MNKARAAGMRMADSLVDRRICGSGNKANVRTGSGFSANPHRERTRSTVTRRIRMRRLERWSYYREDRARELEILRSGRLREEADALGVTLVSFDAI